MNIFTSQYIHYKLTDVRMNLFEKLLTRVEFKSDGPLIRVDAEGNVYEK